MRRAWHGFTDPGGRVGPALAMGWTDAALDPAPRLFRIFGDLADYLAGLAVGR